jgi:predicted Co/Zn/Cd cation transporter (cation efflux family)
VFLVPPLRMVRTMLRELLEAAPDDAVQERVQSAIEAASVAHGLDAPVVRMTKVGTKLYVDAEYLVEPDRTIGETDDVRRALAGALTDLGLDAWLTVEFSADPSWDDPPPVR